MQYAYSSTRSESQEHLDGHSFPLCAKIVEALFTRPDNFHVQTLFVLGHNTRRDSEGNAYRIFHGLVVETSTGLVTLACFDRTSRCLDEIVRRIRVTSAYEDPSWSGKLLETYDTQTGAFTKYIFSLTVQSLSDLEILLRCSTSPSAEAPDFVDNFCSWLLKMLKYVGFHMYIFLAVLTCV
ncbi:hypothetical protein CFP56_014672 [Quercus suber]|uniref:Uncharacterized protein n=1 Tax=Quercus suber TaxID=58331 RepID=A0AAW0KTH9_QUESU